MMPTSFNGLLKRYFLNHRLFSEEDYMKYEQFKVKRIRKIQFKFFDIWKSRMDDPNTPIGKRFMNRLYDELLEMES